MQIIDIDDPVSHTGPGGTQLLRVVVQSDIKRAITPADGHDGANGVDSHPVVCVICKSHAKKSQRAPAVEKELRGGIHRAAHLRASPEHDPIFKELYGLREDTESHHHKLKAHLWGRRARTANPSENALDLIAWQLLENTRAGKARSVRLLREAAG